LISRREIIKLLATIPLTSNLLFAEQNEVEIPNSNSITINYDDVLLPARLNAGDTIAFTAPASPISKGSISNYINFFKQKNCKILIGNTIAKQNNNNRYFSAPDIERANELNSMFADKNVKAIICGRGGYGVSRILPLLDYELIKKNPKILMGYSDITALHLALYRKCCLVSFHGPVASSKLTEEHARNINKLLFSSNDSLIFSYPEMNILNKGNIQNNNIISGRLQGGNLTLISTTMGTPYEIDLQNSIFFVEDTNVLAHDVDRMLTQLLISNKLASCNAIIVGKIRKIDKRGNFYPNRAFTIREIFADIAKQLNIPCILNLPFGHVESHLILGCGIDASINLQKKQIQLLNYL
jgi:muramoyltetrapeptide carboxypeptidase